MYFFTGKRGYVVLYLTNFHVLPRVQTSVRPLQIDCGELKLKRSELKFEVFGFLVHHDRSKCGAIVAQNLVNGTKKLASGVV